MLYRIDAAGLTDRTKRELENMQLEGVLIPVEEEVPIKRRVRLKLDYNLQVDQVSKSMDCAKGRDWTAFVNRKRTLVHVMMYDHPAILIRMPRLKMKEWSNKAMKEFIAQLLYEVY